MLLSVASPQSTDLLRVYIGRPAANECVVGGTKDLCIRAWLRTECFLHTLLGERGTEEAVVQ